MIIRVESGVRKERFKEFSSSFLILPLRRSLNEQGLNQKESHIHLSVLRSTKSLWNEQVRRLKESIPRSGSLLWAFFFIGLLLLLSSVDSRTIKNRLGALLSSLFFFFFTFFEPCSLPITSISRWNYKGSRFLIRILTWLYEIPCSLIQSSYWITSAAF